MARISYRFFRCRGNLIFPAFFWVLGLFCGFCLYLRTDASFLRLICRMQFCPVSVAEGFGVLLLPFLLSAFVASSASRGLIFFGKAVLLGLLMLGIQAVYPAGGILAVMLLLSGSILSSVGLWLLWLRPSMGCTAYLMMPVIIGSVEIFIISPFLAGL